MRRLMTALLVAGLAGPAAAQTIYPLDRAEILAGARFDLKVEFPGAPAADAVAVTINGMPAAHVLKAKPEVIFNEESRGITAYWIRGATFAVPGNYKIEATAGTAKSEVRWEVFDTPAPAAKNVILFIGDGLSNAHRVAARMLSKGIREGRYGGSLAFEDMPHMAMVSTAGTDSIIPESANSMSAYTTGHKACTGALGIYCASNAGTLDHPKVETIAELARRLKGMSVGVVTNTEIEDATPAGMLAHTRNRRGYDDIVEMFFAARPEVMLGGGSANFLPKPIGKRADTMDYLKKFEEAGYKLVATGPQLARTAADPATRHLLGLFHTGNMDGALDRRIL
jgi:alkaline phosphatase